MFAYTLFKSHCTYIYLASNDKMQSTTAKNVTPASRPIRAFFVPESCFQFLNFKYIAFGFVNMGAYGSEIAKCHSLYDNSHKPTLADFSHSKLPTRDDFFFLCVSLGTG